MSKLTTQFKNAVSKFHNDEEGMETLQVVLIVALAAIAGVAVYQFGGQASKWTKDQLGRLFGAEGYGSGGSGAGNSMETGAQNPQQ